MATNNYFQYLIVFALTKYKTVSCCNDKQNTQLKDEREFPFNSGRNNGKSTKQRLDNHYLPQEQEIRRPSVGERMESHARVVLPIVMS